MKILVKEGTKNSGFFSVGNDFYYKQRVFKRPSNQTD
ncbi:hypothetical protein TC_0053 [Chlamydia muridarum str. Nigg]|uniref:Uncharacterized protein n=1 Tax=Chlamydia muridarum (strain MoPn / Nigg) TaxID=243161 RepID=Q9PLP6_CHLMU|nr:hypothetical protein TC_0053 [Chlamydia muridarum str. Nigg]AHH22452.1 hypothetical protein TAC_00290 [Chlamydia muridarum str. Nigg3 CMUT3-5]AHH23376.1 hypothetical protein Y015_00290 [Chlamydia muridarum str. Nigg CM972]